MDVVVNAIFPPLYLRNGYSAYFTGIRMGPKPSLYGCVEYLLHPPELKPRMVQLVATVLHRTYSSQIS